MIITKEELELHKLMKGLQVEAEKRQVEAIELKKVSMDNVGTNRRARRAQKKKKNK
ncbi:MAG TPA: hypothetical protein VL947_06135 [Cytophagales bacterium]|nr:hypothetical protein [Cytophagales bacterium]